jgi:Mrp family chromosome partitioning ATPase
MKQILFDLSKLSDLVILDASSLANSESVELSNLVDGVVLVIDFGRTTQTSIEQSIAKLHLASGRLLGGVLNRSHL